MISLFRFLVQARRELEFKNIAKWKKYWKILQKKETPEIKQKCEWERKFLHNLMRKFLNILESIPKEGSEFIFSFNLR